jgi:NitT/TauT family transport system substrate-binding protein
MERSRIAGALALCFFAGAGAAQAEPAHISIGIQTGIAYVPLHVMAAQHLIEKQGKKLGLTLTADVKNLGQTGLVRDALIAGQIEFGVAGPPTLLTLYEKTRGAFRTADSVVAIPALLNTTNPKIRSVCDFSSGDKIALPTVKSSAQAVILQMASKARCGDAFRNDRFTVSMPHPDGYNALMTGTVSAHMTAPPYSTAEVRNGKGKVRQVLSSYDVMKSKATLLLLITSDAFRSANPRTYRAVREALEEAEIFVRTHPKAAAAIYMKAEKTRESESDIVAQLTSRDVVYGTTPQGLGQFARFMNEIGTLKKLYGWQELCMPELRSRPGS